LRRELQARMNCEGTRTGAAQPVWGRRIHGARAAAGLLDADAELMLQVRQGDQICFALLVERHRTSVIQFLYRMVLNQAVAEELAQEVFLRVFRYRRSYEPTARFTTWLFRIATHAGLNCIRDGRHEKLQKSLDEYTGLAGTQVQDRSRTVEQEMLYQADLREVRQAIENLPEKQRAAVIMHKYEELGYAEIASVFRCSESAVKSLLFRAYESLRMRLAHLA
jgi:RNA polymerase sigma-70 factor (ECF subfamily)